MGKLYACIDLKSFYASVECVERGLDPMTARLVVADPERESVTICLAITPAMKLLGIKNRCRVFEIPSGIDYIMAPPRMSLYMERSAEVYATYLKYISPDDIHVYSIDECFIDLTPYLKLYKKGARELTRLLMDKVYQRVGIPSSAGIGSNLFLAKVALDILAKQSEDGIAELDENSFAERISHHRPITDIWNIGDGTARELAHMGAFDLAGVARIPEEYLYKKFGVKAEFLIDHAHGREPCTIEDIKKYRPESTSISHSQVLFRPYSFSEAELILSEMIEVAVLELVSKELVTGNISLYIGYNHFGRYDTPSYYLPKPMSASKKLQESTNSLDELKREFLFMYHKGTDKELPIRRLGISLGNLTDEKYLPYNLFTDEVEKLKEKALLRAIVDIKDKFGKNAIVKGSSFEEHSTARERNGLIGGHKG